MAVGGWLSDEGLKYLQSLNVRCPSCGALMNPSGTPGTESCWWDCINPYCESGAQPT